MTRQPNLVGQRGERDRVITVLSPDTERGTIPALRNQALALLTPLAPGAAPADADQVLRRLAWQAPRRATGQRPLAAAVLAEAELLGITAAGGLTGYSRTLLSGSRTVAEQVLTSALTDSGRSLPRPARSHGGRAGPAHPRPRAPNSRSSPTSSRPAARACTG